MSSLGRVTDVLVETDGVTGATYYIVADGSVETSVTIDELTTVDMDGTGRPVGVEFAFAHPAHDDWLRLFDRFPDLKESLAAFAFSD